jgi:hypothetical protein
VHYTIVFNAFVWQQLFNELNARSIDDHQNIFKGLHKSPIFIGVLILSAGLQAIIVEFGGSAFKCAPLSWDQWLFCIAVGLVELPLGFLFRAIPVPEKHFVDILQFWNEEGVQRVITKKETSLIGADEVEMMEVELLPYEAAMEAIEEKRLQDEEEKKKEDAAKLERYAEERVILEEERKAAKAAEKLKKEQQKEAKKNKKK